MFFERTEYLRKQGKIMSDSAGLLVCNIKFVYARNERRGLGCRIARMHFENLSTLVDYPLPFLVSMLR
jgi:hypothetical protein